MTAVPEPGADPSRLRLERDLTSSPFESGVDAGLWRLIHLTWPYITVAITAGDGNQLGMRIQADNYPAVAPAGQFWDIAHDVALPFPRWPTGGSAPHVFSCSWSVANAGAPYMACDRVALNGHPAWPTEHPTRSWKPSRTITFYLAEVHHELRSVSLPQAEPEAA